MASEPRLPRKARMRDAATPRNDEFASGSGRLDHPRRLDTRSLQPGQKVMLQVGSEEPLESRVMRGLGAPGRWTGTVHHVDRAGVHLTDHHFIRGGQAEVTELDGGMKVGPIEWHPGEPTRVPHHDIATARVL